MATFSGGSQKVRIPEFHLQTIEDYYVYYVKIVGVSEELFWNADFGFLNRVVENINAVERWKTYIQEKMVE
ncbi:hypothetical protein [Hornefia butyriciproducens]|uniref:hypothetical protein n=1 Tax=Hornefia butyriciproducens TaxID=2652293 RepID=UPI003F89EE5E